MAITESWKMPPSSMRMLFRPILFLALGLHALLLFVPIPQEQKPKEPADKKDPIKITQIPTAKPAAAKKAAVVKVTKTKTTAKSAPANSPATLATTPAAPFTPSTVPSSPLVSSSSIAQSPSGDTASTPAPPSADNSQDRGAIAPKPPIADPISALYDILIKLSPTETNKEADSSNSSNPVPLEEVIQPNLLFKTVDGQPPSADKTLPEGLPGLEKAPLLITFPIENNLNLYTFFEKILEPKAKEVFDIEEAGDYGDGPLYKLTNGKTTLFLSLMPPKKAVGAIVSIWSKDPRENQKAGMSEVGKFHRADTGKGRRGDAES